ncbi:type II toxin-antitoxin system antitoxin SocA domain-containing protein [Sorangium cellulosum]|nr:type II toxin-antitoxin system antitoxin SocA domain-containing protein [Sorangium cellulosum]
MNVSSEEKRDRLLEAAMAILQSVPGGRMKIVNLNKALFYLDLVALQRTGETVTGNAYIALHQGPVVAKYPQRLLKPLESSGLAQQETNGREKPVVLRRPIGSFRYMDVGLQRLAAAVAKRIGPDTAASVSDLSHENPGWQLAYEMGQKHGAPPVPINMLIALQQLADDDPWLGQGIDDDEELRALIDTVDAHASEPW